MNVSIGHILKKNRERKKITMDAVSKETKISMHFIKAIEMDDYSVFSSQTHVKGFLRLYCDCIGINSEEVLALWRRDYAKEFDKTEQTNHKVLFQPKKPKFVISLTTLLYIFTVTLVISFFGYLYYQYKNYSGPPDLTLYSPRDNLVVNSDLIDISGVTELNCEIFINDQKVIVRQDGSFIQSIKLKEGINIFTVKSTNSLGKTNEKLLTVIYRP